VGTAISISPTNDDLPDQVRSLEIFSYQTSNAETPAPVVVSQLPLSPPAPANLESSLAFSALTQPKCGNGVVEGREDCDDANLNDDDDCPNDCTACLEKDIILLIDGSSSIGLGGIQSSFTTGIDTVIRDFDYDNKRIAIADATTWGSYIASPFYNRLPQIQFYDGYDPELITTYKQFLNYGANNTYCSVQNCDNYSFSYLKDFIDNNQRIGRNGEVVPTEIIRIDDGDWAQVPSRNGSDQNRNTCSIDQEQLNLWQSLTDDRISWLRFQSSFTNRCSVWIQPGRMYLNDGVFIDIPRNQTNNANTYIQDLTEIINSCD
jgi:cysteine-rich repeat protein